MRIRPLLFAPVSSYNAVPQVPGQSLPDRFERKAPSLKPTLAPLAVPAGAASGGAAMGRVKALVVLSERLQHSDDPEMWKVALDADAMRATLEDAMADGDDLAVAALLETDLTPLWLPYKTELDKLLIPLDRKVTKLLLTPVTPDRAAELVKAAGGSGVTLARYLDKEMGDLAIPLKALVEEIRIVSGGMGNGPGLPMWAGGYDSDLRQLVALRVKLAPKTPNERLPPKDAIIYAAEDKINGYARQTMKGAMYGAFGLEEVVSWAIASNAGGRLSELRIVGHASPGRMFSGGDWPRARLTMYPMGLDEVIELLRVSPYLTSNAKLVLGGCEVGAQQAGADLLASLATVMGIVTQGSVEIQRAHILPIAPFAELPGSQGELVRCQPAGNRAVCSGPSIEDQQGR